MSEDDQKDLKIYINVCFGINMHFLFSFFAKNFLFYIKKITKKQTKKVTIYNIEKQVDNFFEYFNLIITYKFLFKTLLNALL